MNKYQIVLLGAVILGLASCSEPQASTPEAASTAQSSPAATSAASPASGFTALQDVTHKTLADVKADKYAQAKTEFGNFETSWKTVEDSVMKKAAKTYRAIEDDTDAVNAELKNKQPNKAKLTTTLDALSKNLETASKL